MVEGLRLSLRKYVILTLLAVASVIFALFSIPVFSGLAVLLSRRLLRPDDRPVVLSDAASISGDFTHDRSQASQKLPKQSSD